MKTMVCLIIAFITLQSCQKKSIAPLSAPAPQKGELELLWRQPLLADTSESASMSPVLFEDRVVFSASGRRNGEFSPLLFLDTATGDLIDTWSDWVKNPSFISWEDQQVSDKFLFLGSGASVDVIDMAESSTVWQSISEPQGSGLLYLLGDYVYRDSRSNGFSPNLTGTILRSPLTREDWEPVVSYTADDQYSVGLCCLTEARLPNGDQVLLFKNRQGNFNTNKGRLDVFCYNLTADTLLWRHKGLEDWDGGVIPLKVQDSSVYCLGGAKAFALDLYSGAKRWEFDYAARSRGDHFGFGDLFINGDRILIKPSGEQLFALDKHTGDLLWWRDDMGWTMKGRFTHFENKLFYVADADLIIVDAYSGERLLPKARQEFLGKLNGDVRIDSARRVMYVASYREAFCLKIPDDL